MKNLLGRLKIRFLHGFAFLLYCFYLWHVSTLKISIVNDQFVPQKRTLGENVIYAFWHSKSFTLLPQCGGAHMGTLTLLDWKNVICDKVCRLCGCQTIPVTNLQRATVRLKSLLEKGYPVGLALDGPRGPVGAAKPGVFFLAKITGKPIVAVNVKASKGFRMKSRWDQYEIPLPFTEVAISFSEPFYVALGDEKKIERLVGPFLKDL